MDKKLTREEAIRLHREMWQDMQDELGDNPKWDKRLDFKKKWVEEHFPNEDVISNCFLCEYAESAAKDQYFSRCLKCPIAWNSSIHPTCTPTMCKYRRVMEFMRYQREVTDYRYSPISVILALPEREEKA